MTTIAKGSGITTRDLMARLCAKSADDFMRMLRDMGGDGPVKREMREQCTLAFRQGMAAMLSHLEKMGIVVVLAETPATSFPPPAAPAAPARPAKKANG